MMEGLKKRFRHFYSRSLHRELLDQVIREKSSQMWGRILEVGSRNRRYDAFFPLASEIIATDVKPQRQDVMAADVLQLPFREKVFDGVVSFEVFEYILSIERALGEIARVLKPGGNFLFSVPFLDPVHGDLDNVRYTSKSWQYFLERSFAIKETVWIGGRFSLIWDFYFEKVRNSEGRVTKLLLWPFLLLAKKFFLWLDRKEKNRRYPMGYVYLCALKRSSAEF